MSARAGTPITQSLAPRFRGTLRSDGDLGPIEERYGRRLMRLIDPESDEASALLDAGQVELLGPDGDTFGATTLEDAYGRLVARLEERLDAIDDALDEEIRVLSDCLERIRNRERRVRREI